MQSLRDASLVPFAVAMMICALLAGGTAGGSSDMSEDRIKAAMLLRVARFVEWPSADMRPLRVCVLGSDRFLDALQSVAQAESVQGRAITAVILNRLGDMSNCRITYIAAASDRDLQAVLDGRYKGSTLTVSSIEGFAARGGMVGFFENQGRIGLEINPAAGTSVGLQFSSKLLRLARIVAGPRGR